MYGLTDPELKEILIAKSHQGGIVTVEYDKSASPHLQEELPYPIRTLPSSCKGLMHKKLLVVDQESLFFGSANFTTASLSMHDNLCLGIFHPDLAKRALNRQEKWHTFSIGKMQGELFLLPDLHKVAEKRLLQLLQSAKKSISVAMFTLTHPALVDLLIQKQREGVRVECALDFYTSRGASRKALERLAQEKIPLYLSRGQQLFHHKWALIDSRVLVMGSANWTKSAFTRNEDYFLILSHLPKKDKKFLKKLWKIVKLETNRYDAV